MKRLIPFALAALTMAGAFLIRTAVPVAAVAVAVAPSTAHAEDDPYTYPDGGIVSAASSGGASASMPAARGQAIVLQSHACGFHYRACASSSCTALQTDYFVRQDDGLVVPLTGDVTTIAVACDGSGSGTVYEYVERLP